MTRTTTTTYGVSKSFVVGDSVVIDFDTLIDDVLTATSPYVVVENPITSVVWDDDTSAYVVTGGEQTAPDVYTEETGRYGCVFVPTAPGWHKFFISGTPTYAREGTFYVYDTTISAPAV